VAGAVARRTGRPRPARRAVDAVLPLPGLRLIPWTTLSRARRPGWPGGSGSEGADAVYIAAAAELRLPLVTWDFEQRDQAARSVAVLVPDGKA
jgi:hypothetical protein